MLGRGVGTASQPRPAERETSGGSSLLNAQVWGGRLDEALGKGISSVFPGRAGQARGAALSRSLYSSDGHNRVPGGFREPG